MNKRKVLILTVGIGALCPVFFLLGVFVFFAGKTEYFDLWQRLLDSCQTAPVPFFAPGPIGFACLLTILVRERESLPLWAWIPLFLLLLLNLALIVLAILVWHYECVW